tara:strand:- start:73645 stop:73989 length:345 start_codon:yes stop_codon:yes gene_type:complete
MNKLASVTAAAAVMLAGAATAQTTTQAGVLGNSGDAVYSLQVQGANGVVYNCKPELVQINGLTARRCIDPNAGGLTNAGAGLGNGAVIGAAALVIVAIAAGSDGTSTTTSTSGS